MDQTKRKQHLIHISREGPTRHLFVLQEKMKKLSQTAYGLNCGSFGSVSNRKIGKNRLLFLKTQIIKLFSESLQRMCALVLQCPVSHSCSSSHSLGEFCRRTTRLFSACATEQLHRSRLDSVCFACGYVWVLKGRVIYPQQGHFWSQYHRFDLLLDFFV